jgi:hypothetical protein
MSSFKQNCLRLVFEKEEMSNNKGKELFLAIFKAVAY